MERSQASVFVTHTCTCKWQSSRLFISLSSLELISILNGFFLKHRWEISDAFPSSSHSNARNGRKTPCSSLIFSRHPRIRLKRLNKALSLRFGKRTLYFCWEHRTGVSLVTILWVFFWFCFLLCGVFFVCLFVCFLPFFVLRSWSILLAKALQLTTFNDKCQQFHIKIRSAQWTTNKKIKSERKLYTAVSLLLWWRGSCTHACHRKCASK